MKIALFKDHVLIEDKLFYYKEPADNGMICNLCYFKGLACSEKYREYIESPPYTKNIYCYASMIEMHNRGKISNRIPMITILRPFPYELSLFIWKLITRKESKFKIYEI